jgi:peptide/nickel transport system permease protein
MLKYILKRILIIIPTLFVISLITFLISTNAPGDPVNIILKGNNNSQGQSVSEAMGDDKAYIETREKLGLDLPIFYFSITNSTYCDTLHRIPKPKHREALERLAFNYGNWPWVSNYYLVNKKLAIAFGDVKKTKENAKSVMQAKNFMFTLLKTHEEDKILNIYEKLSTILRGEKSLKPLLNHFAASEKAFEDMVTYSEPGNRYLPQINFYGLSSQYHRWMFGDYPWFSEPVEGVNYHSKGFIRMDFGESYFHKETKVADLIAGPIKLTFTLSIIAMVLTYLISIPTGVYAAVNKGSRGERFVSTSLFMLFSMPNFWVGTLLVVFFCNPDNFDIFPSAYSLMNIDEDAGFWESSWETLKHTFLPMICWTYASLAYISRQMRGGMLAELGKDYIRTARAKGVSERNVIWKHAFRNSLIPVITLFASVFPLAISGSIVVEIIFNIPGMGWMTFEALTRRDYPIVFTVMMFTAVLTLVGSLVADILYAVVDPRISYSNKK